MARITDVRSALRRLPPAVPWADATADVTRLEFVLVEVGTDDGITGSGLTYTVGSGGSAIHALIEGELGPALIGQEVGAEEAFADRLLDRLRRVSPGGVSGLAVAALDVAVWDARARRAGQPLWAALGGSGKPLRTYRSQIDLNLSTDDLAAMIQAAVKDGAIAVKIKVGLDSLSHDVARVAVARDVLGDDRHLMLDANEAWTADEAVRRARAFEPYQPAWLEEPLHADDIEGFALLRQRTSVPIAGGENLYTPAACLAYLKAGAVDVLQPDVARLGGLMRFLRSTQLAAEFGVPVAPHYLYELSAHAVAAAPNTAWLEDVSGGGLAELGLLTRALPFADGFTSLPDTPGWDLAPMSEGAA